MMAMKNSWAWSSVGGMPLPEARRHGMRWNEQEERDLHAGWIAGRSVQQLAKTHERLANAIELRLCKLFGMDFPEELDRMRSMRGLPIPKSGAIWTTAKGVAQPVESLTLDHMLNIVHDCWFRVQRMRHLAVQALGGAGNVNVDSKTFGAFRHVKVDDVFPTYPAIRARIDSEFRREFDVDIDTVRETIRNSWATGAKMPKSLERPTRFVLSHLTMPARLKTYLETFDVGTSAEFQKMCWNLRIDQKACWSVISGQGLTGLLKQIPPSRLNTALRFEEPVTTEPDDWYNFT